MKLVKAKFPTARIAQAKMMNGPIIAYLDDGRKLTWKKAEQSMAEGLTELSTDKLAHYKKAAGADAKKKAHGQIDTGPAVDTKSKNDYMSKD